MGHYFILFLTLALTTTLSGQTPTVYTIKADSVKLTGCDSSELIIENHTQGVPGFLYNTGRGRTVFQRPLTKINDTFYLVGSDTLKMRFPSAWVQGGNSFGGTGILGTMDNNHLDLYTNGTRAARLDSLGNLLVGTTTSGQFKLDVNGPAHVLGYVLDVENGDAYGIKLLPTQIGYGGNVSMLAFGNVLASVLVNKQPYGNVPVNSLSMGYVNPASITTIGDFYGNPIFVAGGNGTATINGGYYGINGGGAVGIAPDQLAPGFTINGGRGTGAGTPGDILFSTGNVQDSGTAIHTMSGRWWIKGGSGFLSNTGAPSSALDITGPTGYSQLGLRTSYTPTSTADFNGNVGDFSWDGNYFYIKTPDGWKRSALTTF